MNARFNTVRVSQNPVVQFFAILAAGAILVVAVLMGALVLVVMLGVGIVLAMVFWLRMLWMRHKLKRAGVYDAFRAQAGEGTDAAQRPHREGRVIEVEYTVVDDDDSTTGRD